jgi:hypothetical protein
VSEAEDLQEAPEIEGGAYEIIRARLETQAKALGAKASALNAQRIEVFGGTEMTVLGNERIRTENNCIPRDIVQIRGHLLFGYNVFLGLKRETRIEDVFSVQDFKEVAPEGSLTSSGAAAATGFAFEPTPLSEVPWLADERFVKDFHDLYTYYKDAHLLQLLLTDKGRLLAVFQTGDKITDVRVLRWAVDGAEVEYIDARGERDYAFPPSHDFEWTETSRDDFVRGRHPHVNILDEVFVETVGGDLTVKVEDSTEDGEGIYRELVEDKHQGLEDARILYAKLGSLILLKILPYREEVWRYLVFNTRTHDVQRLDRIGQSCVQLPEDHGIIFPGGYYLQDGASKTFDLDADDLEFKRALKSPNGEDVMYVFYRRDEGISLLLPYNLIRKEVETPISCSGYTIFDDGRMIVFRAEEEPTRVHHTRIWQTAFMSEEESLKKSATSEHAGSFLVKIGNADLVRGISDAGSVQRAIVNQEPTLKVYEDLIALCARVKDSYHWLEHAEAGGLAAAISEIQRTAELIVDEFEKVMAIRAAAETALAEAVGSQDALFIDIRPDTWETVDHFVEAMAKLRHQRGHLITLKEMRYIDLPKVVELEQQVAEKFDELSEQAVGFLLQDTALEPYKAKHAELEQRTEEFTQTPEAEPIAEELQAMSTQLDLLTEVVAGLQIEDPTARTQILEDITEIFALVNRARATLEARKKELGKREGTAEFGAQFKLFTQSVQSGLGLCDTPEKCDEQLSRLLVQLEELEGRFGEFDEFLGDLASKRDEVYEAFSSKKQALLEARQRRAQNLAGAATRILEGVRRRAMAMKEVDDLNAYFASDAMVMKVRDIAEQLSELGDSVKADEVLSKIKGTRDDATRQLRDKTELFEGGEGLIKFGAHRFSVNTQPLDLTLLPHEDGLALHLTGTDFLEPLEDERLEEARAYWDQLVVSENEHVYRGEYLAFQVLKHHERAGSLEELLNTEHEEDGLLKAIRAFAAERYDEGYDRGVHDADAALILHKLLGMRVTAGLLRFAPTARARAWLYWAFLEDKDALARRARSLGRLRAQLGDPAPARALAAELADRMREALSAASVETDEGTAAQAASYLVEELIAAEEHAPRFAVSQSAEGLRESFVRHLEEEGARVAFEEDLRSAGDDLEAAWIQCSAWATAWCAQQEAAVLADEVAALLICESRVEREVSAAVVSAEVEGLLGQHKRVVDRKLALRLDEVVERLERFERETVPGFRAFRKLRQTVLEEAKAKLRTDEFKPRVLSSFVRNKLINDVYLPLIGDNLAKQIGAAGDKKRTDLMGLLLLISPPGYGKTTLMEYIASRLGLVFMKVNGPSLGHEVTSLDPAEAPNATARQEVEKINLAFEMGNNVMLYLDDIQHTHPELLQKFISLCDGSRRIEGVWNGRTRTYDLRGKKFCVVMAGNPYTESGEKFQIPDMLSNRADTYNLGDILGGKEEAFALSYVENSLTSNAVLQPLATREQSDVYKLVRMAQGEDVPTTDLKHGYSAVEVGEIVKVFEKLLRCQQVLLDVNAEYIRSASMDDRYRTEPPFKLQGSYRNMNKLAEKIVAVMNEAELEQLIGDHYQGEAQTLTTGAEQNVLKLKELRGVLTDDERARWDDIKKTFQRNKMMGGDEDDPVIKVTSTLAGISQQMENLGEHVGRAADEGAVRQREGIERMAQAIVEAAERAEAAEAKSVEQTKKGFAALAKAFKTLDAGASAADAITQLRGELKDALANLDAGASTSEAIAALQNDLRQAAKAILQVSSKSDKALAAGFAKLGEGLSSTTVQLQVSEGDAMKEMIATQRALLKDVGAALKKKPAAAAKAAKSTTSVAVPASSDELQEALAILKKLDDMIEEGGIRTAAYRPFAPKGTRAEDD